MWFPIDVLSIAPSALEIVPLFIGSSQASQGLGALRTMRSLRLIKLVRLAKSSRVISRAMEFVSLDQTSQTCIGLSLQSLLLTHWFACILMISTTFGTSPRGTWLFTHGYCTPWNSTDVADAVLEDGVKLEADAEGEWICASHPFSHPLTPSHTLSHPLTPSHPFPHLFR